MSREGASGAALPAVSIVMPAYNAAAYLQEAVDSVLAQRFADWELIVVDDGSTDATARILEACRERDGRIRILRQANQGQSAARNRAMAEARGAYIGFLDADDRWDPRKLELQLPCFQDPEVGLVYSAVQDIDPDGKPTRGTEPWALHRGWILGTLLRHNFICCSSVLLRRELLDRHRLSFLQGRYCEDWLLWCQVCCHGAAAFAEQPLVAYRVHPGGISRNLRRMEAGELACRQDLVARLRRGEVDPRLDRMRLLREARLDLHRNAYELAKRSLREGDRTSAWAFWRQSARALPPRPSRIWRTATFPLRILLRRLGLGAAKGAGR